MDARPKTRQVDRERKTSSTQVPRGAKQIVIPERRKRDGSAIGDIGKQKSHLT